MTASEDDSTDGRRRKVRFHGRVQFKTIRHVADFSDEEITDGWYRKNDFIRMSDEVAEIAKLLADGKEFHDGEELCIRGLEHLVEEDVADYRAEKMIASIDAVLDEQDDQADENVYDPDVIAEIYGEIVSPLLREAYLVGLRDAKEGAAAAALIPDVDTEKIVVTQENQETHESDLDLSETFLDHRALAESIENQDLGDTHEQEYTDLPPTNSHLESDCDVAEGHLKLNTSLSSIGIEVHPGKKAPQPTKKTLSEKKSLKNREKAEGSKTEKSQKSPTRKNLRRKTFNRKAGTELSPFVFRRDGTIKFRNFDVEHRKREQSKIRKECIQSSMFKFLEDEGEEEDITLILSKSSPRKKNKNFGAGLPRRKLPSARKGNSSD